MFKLYYIQRPLPPHDSSKLPLFITQRLYHYANHFHISFDNFRMGLNLLHGQLAIGSDGNSIIYLVPHKIYPRHCEIVHYDKNVVYIHRWSDFQIYIGQTMDMTERLKDDYEFNDRIINAGGIDAREDTAIVGYGLTEIEKTCVEEFLIALFKCTCGLTDLFNYSPYGRVAIPIVQSSSTTIPTVWDHVLLNGTAPPLRVASSPTYSSSSRTFVDIALEAQVSPSMSFLWALFEGNPPCMIDEWKEQTSNDKAWKNFWTELTVSDMSKNEQTFVAKIKHSSIKVICNLGDRPNSYSSVPSLVPPQDADLMKGNPYIGTAGLSSVVQLNGKKYLIIYCFDPGYLNRIGNHNVRRLVLQFFCCVRDALESLNQNAKSTESIWDLEKYYKETFQPRLRYIAADIVLALQTPSHMTTITSYHLDHVPPLPSNIQPLHLHYQDNALDNPSIYSLVGRPNALAQTISLEESLACTSIDLKASLQSHLPAELWPSLESLINSKQLYSTAAHLAWFKNNRIDAATLADKWMEIVRAFKESREQYGATGGKSSRDKERGIFGASAETKRKWIQERPASVYSSELQRSRRLTGIEFKESWEAQNVHINKTGRIMLYWKTPEGREEILQINVSPKFAPSNQDERRTVHFIETGIAIKTENGEILKVLDFDYINTSPNATELLRLFEHERARLSGMEQPHQSSLQLSTRPGKPLFGANTKLDTLDDNARVINPEDAIWLIKEWLDTEFPNANSVISTATELVVDEQGRSIVVLFKRFLDIGYINHPQYQYFKALFSNWKSNAAKFIKNVEILRKINVQPGLATIQKKPQKQERFRIITLLSGKNEGKHGRDDVETQGGRGKKKSRRSAEE